MLTEEQIRELKAKHGASGLYAFETELGVVVLRTPTRPEFSRFVDTANQEGGSRSAAMLDLVRACVAYPEPKDFESIIDRRPGYVVQFAAKLQELAGNSGKLEGKSL